MKGSCKVAVTVLLLLVAGCQDKAAIKTLRDSNGLKMGMFVDGKQSGLGLVASQTNQIDSIGSWKGGAIDPHGWSEGIAIDAVRDSRVSCLPHDARSLLT